MSERGIDNVLIAKILNHTWADGQITSVYNRFAERVNTGLRRGRDGGRPLGRPRVKVGLSEVQRMGAKGMSLRAIALKLKISKSTVARLLKSD